MDLYSQLARQRGPLPVGQVEASIKSAIAGAPSRGQVITGYRPITVGLGYRRGTGTRQVPIFGRDPKAAEEDLRKEQARLAGIQQTTFEAQQADIAKQLQIVQNEKSAVSKMQEEYTNMLLAEAERKKAAEEQAKRDLQTQRANQAMAGRSGDLQIQGASTTPRVGGTQQFRRRVIQQGTVSPYKGLSTIQSGMVNV